MFETLYRRSFTAQLQKSAAFAESRTNYLDHMNKQGLPRATIRGFARDMRCRTPRDADSSKNKYSGNEIVNDWMEEEVRTSQYTRTRIIAAARSLATVLGIVRGRSALEPLRRESGTVHTLYAGRPRARSCHHLVSLEHHRGFSFLASELENFLIRRCSRRHRLFPGM
jgi:hypothetical protein